MLKGWADEEALTAEIITLASQYGRFGYGSAHTGPAMEWIMTRHHKHLHRLATTPLACGNAPIQQPSVLRYFFCLSMAWPAWAGFGPGRLTEHVMASADKRLSPCSVLFDGDVAPGEAEIEFLERV